MSEPLRAAHDAINRIRDVEREHCAQLAERLADQGRDGYQIARVIRAGIRAVITTDVGGAPDA